MNRTFFRPPAFPFFSSAPCSRLLSNCYSRLRDASRSGDHSGLLSLFLHSSRRSREQPAKIDIPTLLLVLKASAALSYHHLVTSIHAHVLKSGFHDDVIVSTALVDALSRCSDVDGARQLFDQKPERDTAAWNSMLSCYARNGHPDWALVLFHHMGRGGTRPNRVTLSVLLQVCSGLEDKRLGRCIHAYVYKQPEVADIFLYNSLLVCYNKLGDLNASERLFERLVERDIVSWNAMMSGFMRGGLAWRALEMFRLLREQGLHPDLVTLETALQACAHIGEDAINYGELTHALQVKLGLPVDVYAENSLLLMYCRCRRMQSGQSVFDEMETRNTVSWNILVSGYVEIRSAEKAIALFNCMRSVGSEVSSDLFVSALQAAKLIGEHPKLVMFVHCLVIVMGFHSDVHITSALIAAYGDCKEVEFARRCLDCMESERCLATVCWNTMLSVHVRQGYYSEAVELIHIMQLRACTLDAITLVNALSVCIQCLDLEMGKAVHGFIIRNQFELDVFVTTSLLELYFRSGRLSSAFWLFSNMPLRNVVSWNTMIHGCLQNGFPRMSLQLFHLMQQQDGLVPDSTSVVGVIEAIAERSYETEGNYIHEYVVQAGLVNEEFVANSLIAMHARFHDFEKVSMVFDRVSKPNLATWNTMIAEHSYHGQAGKAISVFHQMKLNNVALDSITLLCLLRACASLGSLNCVMWAHTVACKAGYEFDVYVGTSLQDVYAKCGDLGMARLVFNKINSKTTISWNSMIQGYGIHGNAEEASRLFSQMQQSGLDPTMVTFLVLISACRHAGDVEKGQHYYNLMTQAYPFSPREEHFSCFVDLLCRSGLVKEAYDSLEKMPTNHGVCTWGALLGACRVQGNLEVGLAVAERLLELDPLHCGYNVLLSNMYVESGKWVDASSVRSNFDKLGLRKVQGWSKVENSS